MNKDRVESELASTKAGLPKEYKTELTSRGFAKTEFIDRYGEVCSIQESSLATERAIWFGVNEVVPQVCVRGEGWKKVPIPHDALISGRMHLTQQMVKDLLPMLQVFAETGYLTDPKKEKS